MDEGSLKIVSSVIIWVHVLSNITGYCQGWGYYNVLEFRTYSVHKEFFDSVDKSQTPENKSTHVFSNDQKIVESIHNINRYFEQFLNYLQPQLWYLVYQHEKMNKKLNIKSLSVMLNYIYIYICIYIDR